MASAKHCTALFAALFAALCKALRLDRFTILLWGPPFMMPLNNYSTNDNNNCEEQQHLSLELSDAAWEELLQLSENQGRPLATIAHELISQHLS